MLISTIIRRFFSAAFNLRATAWTYGYLTPRDSVMVLQNFPALFENSHERDRILTYPVLLKYGDLLRNTGDVLLCPVSHGFTFSNPLSRIIDKREKSRLSRWVMDSSKCLSESYKSEHCIFLPVRHLRYRAVVLVEMDFYSNFRSEANTARVVEAVALVSRFNCCKLTIPKNILYEPSYENDLAPDRELFNITRILTRYSQLPDFLFEVVMNIDVPPRITYFRRHVKSALEKYPYSMKIFPFMHEFSDKVFLSQEYRYSKRERNIIKDALMMKDAGRKEFLLLFKLLRAKFGFEYDTGVGIGNFGYKKELAALLIEMPWHEPEMRAYLDRRP